LSPHPPPLPHFASTTSVTAGQGVGLHCGDPEYIDSSDDASEDDNDDGSGGAAAGSGVAVRHGGGQEVFDSSEDASKEKNSDDRGGASSQPGSAGSCLLSPHPPLLPHFASATIVTICSPRCWYCSFRFCFLATRLSR